MGKEKDFQLERLKKDFDEFSAAASEVPEFLSEKVKSEVQLDLHHFRKVAYLKIGLLHLIGGCLTLLVCPQFGVGPLGGGMGLMHFVMAYGEVACALFCGALFMGSSAVLQTVFSNRLELAFYCKHAWFHSTVLSFSSMALLMILGGNWPTFLFAAFWLAAAVGFSKLVLMGGQELRPFEKVESF